MESRLAADEALAVYGRCPFQRAVGEVEHERRRSRAQSRAARGSSTQPTSTHHSSLQFTPLAPAGPGPARCRRRGGTAGVLQRSCAVTREIADGFWVSARLLQWTG